MTPQVFEGTDAKDEYTFMQTPGAAAKLRRHHKTFITEEDFAWMKSNGIEAVRIPVGYWILNGDDPYIRSVSRLDWAFAMCEKYGLYIVLDIHGLPGSQNGMDHSGHSGKRQWLKSGNRAKGMEQTLQIARRYAGHPMLWGVQIINEPPVGLFQFSLRRYYHQCYVQLVKILPENVRVVYSDAFSPRLMSGAVPSNQQNPSVMDIHWYHFVGWGWMKPDWHKHVISRHKGLIRSLKRWDGIIIGEWSGCYSQRIFDSYPVATHDQMVKQHIKWQLDAYEPADAWFYWNYKTQKPGVWNFRSLIENGLVSLEKTG